jgi:hypothetical protein
MERCACCGKRFRPNPRLKQQRYCSQKKCQKIRRRRWQKRKLVTDEDYRRNQADAQRRWRRRNPEYWRTYRRDHPDYTNRNRELQRDRSRRRRDSRSRDEVMESGIAKMDALAPASPIVSGTYKIFPESGPGFAKMDPLIIKLTVLSSSYKNSP